MKVLYSPASPYSAKVRMATHYCDLDFDSVPTDTNADPDLLIGSNPLGKIPTLINDDGRTVYDSRTIMQYPDRAKRSQAVSAKRQQTDRCRSPRDAV